MPRFSSRAVEDAVSYPRRAARAQNAICGSTARALRERSPRSAGAQPALCGSAARALREHSPRFVGAQPVLCGSTARDGITARDYKFDFL